jgi:ribosomal protein S30
MSHSDNDDLIRAVSPWLVTSECMQVRNLGWEIIEATIRSQVRKIIDHQINSPADRDDCYQEVTIALWQQLPQRITDPKIRSKQVHKIIPRVKTNVQNYFPQKKVPDDSRDIPSHHGGFLRRAIERNDTAHFGSLTDPVRGDVCRFRR